MKKDLSWIPVRSGRRYCSPACGRGCTIEEHRDATRRALAIVKSLGLGWAGRVSENLGWHASAEYRGGATIVSFNNYYRKSFSAFVARGQFAATAATPRRALKLAVAAARASIAEVSASVRGL